MSTRTITEPLGQGVSVTYTVGEVIAEGQTAYQHYVIADTPAYGRTLFLDSLIQSSAVDEALYHEPLIHPGVLLHGGPKRVLVAGAGEGSTMRELLRHPCVEHILTVDLDAEVVEACKQYLPEWHQGSFDDPRVELRFEDIQDTLARSKDGEWDMIVLDITDPVEEGPSVDLFTVRFYSEVARVLADDGIVTMQCGELDPVDMRVCRTVRTTLSEVFPWLRIMQTYVPSFHSLWGIGMCAKQKFDTEPADLGERIAAIEGLRMYDLQTHRALLHLPKFLREQLEQPGKIVTGSGERRLISYDVRGTGVNDGES
ncbi:Spermidine synthase [Enhygromyxa salina]|uniref:Polyamine aminopropyltransferase n=1 Tax=Enhygromyxa salina TaxID=215803 RepID=A0A2S9Y4H9_9BACT|nr:spermidine synthase [Enhygromyxa salina]PRP99998.1 Spermidine synthase [Enhygromyxa salina]